MSGPITRSTSFDGLSPPSETPASGSDPTIASPVGTTKALHRKPYQHLPNPVSSSPRRSSSEDRLLKPDGGFSPPFLHPMSLRTKRSHSPFSASTQNQKPGGGKRSKTKFTMSPPNSPAELNPEHDNPIPRPSSSSPTMRGFLTLPTPSKVVAVFFACCVILLFKAFLGVGRDAGSYGVY